MSRLSILLCALPLALLPACSRRECDIDADCPLGNACDSDGVCVLHTARTADPLRAADRIARGGDDAVSPAATSDTIDVDARIAGHVGNLVADCAAHGVAWSDGADGFLQFYPGTYPSTFVAVHFVPLAALRTPGVHTVVARDVLETTWAQACSYDTASYDETLGEVVITVPDEDDDDIVIEFDSGGSDAVVTFPQDALSALP